MQSKATTVDAYLASLPDDRRKALEAIRKVINKNIDKSFEEGIQYGMMAWYLPHSKYPAGYHCDPKQPLPFASVASQKNHIGLYLFCLYTDPKQVGEFQREWTATGKKLDMGKSCVRVKRLEDIPLELVGKTFKRIKAKDFVATYEASINRAPTPRAKIAAAARAKKAKQATSARKPAAKKAKKVTKRPAKKA